MQASEVVKGSAPGSPSWGAGGGKWSSPMKQWMREGRGITDKDRPSSRVSAAAEALPAESGLRSCRCSRAFHAQQRKSKGAAGLCKGSSSGIPALQVPFPPEPLLGVLLEERRGSSPLVLRNSAADTPSPTLSDVLPRTSCHLGPKALP